MFHLTDSHLHELTHIAAKAAGLKGQGERVAGEAIRMGVGVLSIGAMSYVNGRYSGTKDHFELAGVPVDLAGGLGLSVLALMGTTGKFDEIVATVGGGMLGAYSARMGMQWGAAAKVAQAAGTPAATTSTATKGVFGVGAPALYRTVDADHVHRASGWAT